MTLYDDAQQYIDDTYEIVRVGLLATGESVVDISMITTTLSYPVQLELLNGMSVALAGEGYTVSLKKAAGRVTAMVVTIDLDENALDFTFELEPAPDPDPEPEPPEDDDGDDENGGEGEGGEGNG